MQSTTVMLGGGLDLVTPVAKKKPGTLIQSLNVEQKIGGGYARMLGYTKFDEDMVPGEGNILGVWRYNDKVYAFRKALSVATATMYESTGSGWTSKKTGLVIGGSYEFVNYNFAGTMKMYGVNGGHKAFEWDGTTWTDLTTGMTTDTPEHIIAHKKHLFLSFDYSVQNSAIGDPTTWTPITGASEIAVEDGVTGFMQMSGGTLAIFGRNSTNILSGNNTSDWNLSSFVEYGNRIGAVAGTIQQLGSRVKYLDDRGLTDLGTSDRFGDYADATVSYAVNDILLPNKDNITTSCVVKNKSQYRIFFADGGGLAFTFVGDNMSGATKFKFPDPILVVSSQEDENGSEVIYFGSTNGYIYVMESGNDHDSVAIEAYMRLAYSHMNKPRNRKRFRRANFDIAPDGGSTIQVKPDYQYESAGTNPPIEFKDMFSSGGGSLLGEEDLGSFILGAAYIKEGQVDIPGHGAYVSLFFYSNTIESPWEIDSVTFDFTFGRNRR